MKKSIKLVTAAATAMMLGGVIAPATISLADSIDNNGISVSKNKAFDELYSELTPEKKSEFQKLIDSEKLTNEQQYQILQDTYTVNHQASPRWKVAVLKQAIKYAAKLVGTKLSEKGLADFVNYLTGFEDNIQSGLENGLVKYCHVNRTVAKWAAKTVVFIFF